MNTTTIREVIVKYKTKKTKYPIHEPREVAELFRKVAPDNSREHLIAFYLDGQHNVSAYSIVHTGTANQCPVSAREVFQRAIVSGSIAVIVAHNHPSDNTVQSKEDEIFTTNMIKAGKLLCIPVIDSIIVTDKGYKSFRESNLIG